LSVEVHGHDKKHIYVHIHTMSEQKAFLVFKNKKDAKQSKEHHFKELAYSTDGSDVKELNIRVYLKGIFNDSEVGEIQVPLKADGERKKGCLQKMEKEEPKLKPEYASFIEAGR